MRVLAAWLIAFGLPLPMLPLAHAQSALAACERGDGTTLRDRHWRQGQQHPLVGQVLEGDNPIAVSDGGCTRSPVQQLIVAVWDTIRSGGIVLLGEVHDNPEHHAVRGDILRPRLAGPAPAGGLRPAALFEHIRTSQQAQLDAFHAEAARSGRPGDAADLLRALEWERSGWPSGSVFRPLFQAALGAGLPILPAGTERERMRRLMRGDRSDATKEELARIGMAERMPAAFVDALGAELEASHCGAVPAAAFGAMSLAQRYADAHMAEALVAAARGHGGAFLLAGNGHVRTDRGVPWYVRQMAPGLKVVAVMLVEVAEGKEHRAAYVPRAPDGTAAADYVLFTPRHDRPDPCEKMRQEKR
jgi:uncharacterized iron-regulated protein